MRSTSEIKRTILEKFKSYDVDLFLFGSQAKGTGSRHSDYDVGYWSEEKIPFTLLAELKEELENLDIPETVELVDFKQVPSEFSKLSLKKVEIWKQKKKNSLFTSKK